MSKRRSDISSTVMDQIKQGHVRMKPRSYYSALSVLSATVVISAGISIAYLVSVAFFWYRIQTAGTFAWGARANLHEAIATFPWWALAGALLLGVAAISLVRHQGHLYRHRISTLVLILLSLSLLLGLGLAALGIGAPHSPGDNPRGPGQGWRQNL